VVTGSGGNDALEASIKAAINDAAPFPLPDEPEARRQARSFTSSFTSK
jgi:colicin import membrane protein